MEEKRVRRRHCLLVPETSTRETTEGTSFFPQRPRGKSASLPSLLSSLSPHPLFPLKTGWGGLVVGEGKGWGGQKRLPLGSTRIPCMY